MVKNGVNVHIKNFDFSENAAFSQGGGAKIFNCEDILIETG